MRVQWSRRWGMAAGGFVLASVLGCNDLTGHQGLPAGTNDPAFYSTPAGAVGMRNAAIYYLENGLPNYITDTGLLTDELTSSLTGAGPGYAESHPLPLWGSLDERILPALTGNVTGFQPAADIDYQWLQAVRGDVSQALGALAAYDTTPDVPRLRGELYALNGYAEILLADFFCSGVPLSTVDFLGDFTYRAGSTTQQVYQVAIAQEDSAIALAGSDDTIGSLASVLKGRALLDLGDYAGAAQAVASVPDGFQYRLAVQWAPSGVSPGILNHSATVADGEAGTGLPFISSNDPRSQTTVSVPVNVTGNVFVPLTFPSKYSIFGYSPLVLADWIEARLIRAEAALQSGDVTTWLNTLNTLRTDGTTFTPAPDTIVDTLGYTGCTTTAPCGSSGIPTSVSYAYYTLDSTYTVSVPAGPVQTRCTTASRNTYRPCNPANVQVYVARTLYNAGTAGVAGLAPLTDPGTDAARISLMFQERGYWLFLTGHRQGDLRRLVRQYGQSAAQVYPSGTYLAPGAGQYGGDVDAPIPYQEYTNPLFHGCLNRGA